MIHPIYNISNIIEKKSVLHKRKTRIISNALYN